MHLHIKNNKEQELPVQLQISFRKIYDFVVQYASDENKSHPFHLGAITVKNEIEKFPYLIEGFSDFSLLEKHKDIVSVLMEGLFPKILENNEIKAAMMPFSFESFKLSTRFQNIIKNAGDDFQLQIRNFNPDLMYQQACAYILATHYGYVTDLSRPFYLDIPNKNTGIVHHYRMLINADFAEFEATDKAPKITEDDYKLLLDNFDNIDIWKEKFPPNSYIFKGFGLMNLFDVTSDETIAGVQSELLKTGEDITERIEAKMRVFFGIKDLAIGFSVYDISSGDLKSTRVKKHQSRILGNNESFACEGFFCEYAFDQLFHKNEAITISNVDAYGEKSDKNGFYQQLKKHKVGSAIIFPIKPDNVDNLVLFEIISPRAYELNSINQSKLSDILPMLKTAVERSNAEYENLVDAVIQENYTSIHPTVKWRFVEAAQKYLSEKKEETKIDDIVFNNVYPLYGQSDIKGSSVARNNAIKVDLMTQLSLAISVLKEACKSEKMPIYSELMFRVEEYLLHVEEGLKSGDETSILSFLQREIYPVFKHIKTLNPKLKKLVKMYMNRLDTNLQVVYEKRKAYEDSVTILNDRLSYFIDKKQEEAQAMFPHYFERYKTDGVEYNMYIGQSMVRDRTYNEVYLQNLRLWQLQLMCEMENLAMKATQDMEHELRVASLILVHSNPLAIKFRMDEKQFDVDGAYNIRYEIIKKRIDKAHIKNTNERLTVPNKIAIVYSQEKDALEYLKYIKYLQSKNKLGKLEMLDLEDLQGVSGLKAMRVEVIYDADFCEKSLVSMEELMGAFE